MNPGKKHDLVVPPEKDFDDFAKQISLQQGNFSTLSHWARSQCATAHDLTGILSATQPLVGDLSHAFAGKLDACSGGMAEVWPKAKQAGKVYHDTDRANDKRIRDCWPKPLPAFPDIGEVPGLQHLGDFNDHEVKLDELDPQVTTQTRVSRMSSRS